MNYGYIPRINYVFYDFNLALIISVASDLIISDTWD